MIIDRNTSNHDYLECSKASLKTIEFNLRDSRGRYIPLHGANVSFYYFQRSEGRHVITHKRIIITVML